MDGSVKNTVFRRLKYLILLQKGEKLRLFKAEAKKKRAFVLGLKLLIIVAVTAILSYGLGLISNILAFDMNMNLLIFVLFITQIVDVITCTGNIMSVLYSGKENSILFVYPVKYNEIFLSKLILFVLTEFKRSCYFIFPFLIAFGINASVPLSFWLLLLPLWASLCILPVLIGADLSIVANAVKRFLSNHVWLYALVLIAALCGAFVLILQVLQFVPVPLRLLALYDKILANLGAILTSVNRFALYSICLGNVVFGVKLYIHIPILLGTFAGLILICRFLVMPFYFKATSTSAENSRNKKHKPRETHFKGLFFTFLRKEFRLMLRSSQSVNSAVCVVLLFPMLTYVLNFILSAINTNSFGDYMTVGFNVMITLSLLSIHNANGAMALSSEGSEFAVLKVSPANTMIMSWAKIAVTMIVNFLAIIVTVIMLALTTSLKPLDFVLMTVLIMLFSLGTIFWNFQIDLTNPKLSEYIIKGDSFVDNGNVAKALVLGFILSTVAGVITLLLLVDDYASGWARALLIALGYFLLRLYLYRSNLKVYFDDIQA